MRPHVALESSRIHRATVPRINYSIRFRCSHSDAATTTAGNKPTPGPGGNGLARQIVDERDFFLDVLGATATKREAKSYLSRFGANTPKKAPLLASSSTTHKIRDSGVNLGALYLPIRSVEESPVFSQVESERPFTDPTTQPLRTALVLLKASESDVDDHTLVCVSHTLLQLSKLGLSCVVLVESDFEEHPEENEANRRNAAVRNADRVVAAIEKSRGGHSRRLDGILNLNMFEQGGESTVKAGSNASVVSRDLLLKPLYRGVIPVIAPLAFDVNIRKVVPISSKDIALALARDLSGLAQGSGPQEDWSLTDELRSKSISLDRIIILDPHGGIPSTSRLNGSHVFINLEQEYDRIRNDLESLNSPDSFDAIRAHTSNLELARDVLRLLPSSSSAFITTPAAASASNTKAAAPSPSTPGVGTRTQRNALIHNLLTDKPVFSSSLPMSRLSPTPESMSISPRNPQPPTFLKHGLPVTIFPDPQKNPWKPPSESNPPFSLRDPRLDMARLIHLIEDSFGRKLDAHAYFERIAPRLAGIIIAGQYEGGAILTWETPPALELQASATQSLSADNSRLVPYLDKFAVLQRSQGAGGVADVVFNVMVRECFPHGVAWRSRTENPVNKWYFERARGSWKIPSGKGKQGWTMFWTTEGVDGEKFADYEGVCRSIGTNWADGRVRLD